MTLILPLRDRAGSAADLVNRWHQALANLGRPYELIAVDDGSADGTGDRLLQLAGRLPHVRVVPHQKPRGVGAALRTGIASARMPLIAYVLPEGSYHPRDLARLMERLEKPEPIDDDTALTLDLVNGHRAGVPTPAYLRPAAWAWRNFWNLLLNLNMSPAPGWLGWRTLLYRLLCRQLFGLRLGDLNSGMKVFRRKAVERFPIQSDGPFVHTEILAKANFLGCIMDEQPLSPPPPPDRSGGVYGPDFRAVLSKPRFHCGPKPALVRFREETSSEGAMTQTIDAHHHLWRLDQFDYSFLNADALAPIRRDFLPEDLLPLTRAQGVDRTVLVQTQHNLEENRWALGLAERHDFIAGVVGWVDLAGESCEEQLLEFKGRPKFVGVRHIVQDEPDDDFIIRPEILRGLGVLQKHGVPYDLLFYAKHLRHAPALAEKLPDLPMVIDHLSKPNIKAGEIERWEAELRAAARYPNVYCKLSGLITEADWKNWKPEDLRPYVRVALDSFGPDRCMFGSDWPVCLLAGRLARVIEELTEALGPLSDAERAKIFGETAARFYGLNAGG